MSTSNSYFASLQYALVSTGRDVPRLLIDLDAVDHNLKVVAKQVPSTDQLRLVVKSLPAPGLLAYIRERIPTQRLMAFHQPFLIELAGQEGENTDILLGKPMTARTAEYFYNHLPDNPVFDPFTQVQWLVDSTERLVAYASLAERLDCGVNKPPLRINLEINVGLHRGGFASLAELDRALKYLADHDVTLQLSGLMGYDPHVVKVPPPLGSQRKLHAAANDFYEKCIALISEKYPKFWREDLTFNGAGSPTLALHAQTPGPLSELAVGSALLKPSTFDIPTLSAYQPACYIGTPALKVNAKTTLPGLGWLPLPYPSCFIYGGFWKADFCHPKGAKTNKLFGPSTNQSLVNLPRDCNIQAGDYLFLRPHQSELVLLQFGALLGVRNGVIEQEWPTFSN